MQQPVPSCRFGMIVCTAASIVAQTASVSLIIAAISRVSSICSIFRILRRVTSLSHRRISGRCGTMHTIQFWTVSLPHWARICRPILISLLTCICPPSALQIRKPVNTLTTPICSVLRSSQLLTVSCGAAALIRRSIARTSRLGTSRRTSLRLLDRLRRKRLKRHYARLSSL